LRDLAVILEPAADGRTARVTVVDNDADDSGEHAPVAGAEVLMRARKRASGPSGLASSGADGEATMTKVTTNSDGIAGFATPPDVEAADIVLAVHHPDYNPRHVRLDGRNLCIDLRRELYG